MSSVPGTIWQKVGLTHFQLIAGFELGLAAIVQGFGRFLTSAQWASTIFKESDTGRWRHDTHLASIIPLLWPLVSYYLLTWKMANN